MSSVPPSINAPLANATPKAKASSGKSMKRPIGGNPASTSKGKTPSKKKKISDPKNIPECISSMIPESDMYQKLQDVEKRIDTTIIRKKFDIQEALRMPQRVSKTLRIWIYNTHENQSASFGAVGERDEQLSLAPPSWTLKIQGRLFERRDGALEQVKYNKTLRKFSSFFSEIHIQLDSQQYPGKLGQIAWERNPSVQDMDGFEVRRKGTENVEMTILLMPELNPTRFRLSTQLSLLLGEPSDVLLSKPRITARLWEYIRARGLQDETSPGSIRCDPALSALLGNSVMIDITSLWKLLERHVMPPLPIEIKHTIRVDCTSSEGEAVWDLQVEIEDPLITDFGTLLGQGEPHKEIVAIDSDLSQLIQQLDTHRLQREFYHCMATAPVEFLSDLVRSMTKDYRRKNADDPHHAIGGKKVERRAGPYCQPWAASAADRYLGLSKLASSHGDRMSAFPPPPF